MSGSYTIFDSKENLFLAFNNRKNAWIWIAVDKFKEEYITYSFIIENFIEEFLISVNNGKGKDLDYTGEFVNEIIDAIPNVWLVRIKDDGHRYIVDFTDGIKI